MTDLLTLAIGLVLGGCCAVVWQRVKRAESEATDAKLTSEHAMQAARSVDTRTTNAADQLGKHDHEIATLYDRANLRRE